MRPNKRTKAYKEEVVMLYWGIDPRTFRVEHISRTRSGILRTAGYSHVIHPSQKYSPEREIGIVWQLTDIFSVVPHLWNDEYTVRQIDALKAKAELMKAEAEKIAAQPTKTGPVSSVEPERSQTE